MTVATWRDHPTRTVWAGEEHLAEIHAAQYALIDHLRAPSALAEVRALKKAGPVDSLSAIFMLRLMDESEGLNGAERDVAA